MNAPLDIPPMLDRRPFVGTYTNLNSYANCGHSFFRRYIKKDQPYVESKEMKWGNDVHAAFEYRVGGKKPLPAEMEQWETFAAAFDAHKPRVEQKLGITSDGSTCDFWASNVWFRGKVDLTIIDGAKCYIADWKTGSSRFEDPFELETGAMLVKARYPEVTTFFGNYIWLKENRVGQQYNLSDVNGTFREVHSRMAEIAEDRAANTWEKKPSGLCGYCSVKDCEHWKERR